MKSQLLLLFLFLSFNLFAQLDTIPPVITLIGPDTVRSAVYMHYDDLGATAYDLKDGVVAVTKTSTVDTANIGVFMVTYNAHDAAGNQSISKKRIVIIIDTVNPVITIVGDNPMIICKQMALPYIDPGATVNDNYDKGITLAVAYYGPMNKYGTYRIKYFAIDLSGNTDSAIRIIHVVGNCIAGNIFYDRDKNCSLNATEENTNLVHLTFRNLKTSNTVIINPDNIGTFGVNAVLDTGTYLVKVIPAKPYIKVACAKDSFYYTHTPNSNSVGDIPIVDTLFSDLFVYFEPFNHHRLGMKNSIRIDIKSIGRLNLYGPRFEIEFPNGIKPDTSINKFDSIAGNKAFWHLDSIGVTYPAGAIFDYFADTSIYHLGDSMVFKLKAISKSVEIDTLNNYDILKRKVVASYDPNEKYCSQPSILKAGVTDFNYTVMFQNTGNAEAFDIQLNDTIDSRFDLNTLQITEASHRHRMFIKDNVLIVRFEEIYLPDSHANEPKSHGFFSYSVKLKKPLSLNEEIKNTAYIYFDNNPPVVTNTTANKYVLSGLINTYKNELIVYPNPAESAVHIQNYNNEKVVLYDLLGNELKSTFGAFMEISEFTAGIYILRMNEGYIKLIKK